MIQHPPPHPGEVITETYLKPLEISGRELAKKLHVYPTTINRVLQSKASVSTDMAIRLSKALGLEPETWLSIQANYDLWHTLKNNNYETLKRISLNKASQD